MHPLDELKSYVGFTDDDSRRLRALLPLAEPRFPVIIDRFYATIKAHPGARAVLTGDEQVTRLKGTLRQWLLELLRGPHDETYYERRLSIGRAHVRVKLPSQYMFTAMHLIRSDLMGLCASTLGAAALDEASAEETRVAVNRICDIELAVMVGTYMEEHEKRELEELGGLMVRSLPLTAFLLDAEGHVSSAAAKDRHIFLDDNNVEGLPFEEALRREFLEATELPRHIARAKEKGHEIVLPRVDVAAPGGLRVYRVMVLPLEHRLASAMIAAEDLTDSVAIEARIQQAEYLSKLGTMAASVAHELRNPLAGFSSTLQLIAASLPDRDRRRGMLDKVQEQIKRLDLLVSDLLSFARPTKAQRHRFDIHTVAQQTVADVAAGGFGEARVEGKGSAVGDRLLLAQVLLNLVQNAFQAGATEVVIDVSDGRMRVVDDGPGIPPDAVTRVFEPFFTTKTRGTGLGLPVARRAVEAMGGNLELCASPLGGAGFEVHLPTVE